MKKLLLFVTTILITGLIYSQGVRLDDLPNEATSLTGNEWMYVLQDNVSKKMRASLVAGGGSSDSVWYVITIAPQDDAPVSPDTGAIYLDRDDKILRMWDGQAWDTLNTAGAFSGSGFSFINLTDTPGSFTGHANKAVTVNSGESDLEFTVLGDLATQDDVTDSQVPDDITITESDPVYTAWDKDYDDLTNTPSIPDTSGLSNRISADSTILATHLAASDPHNITKSDVDLGNVPNVDATDRSNHTGTQTMSTISDAGDLATQDNVTDAQVPNDITITALASKADTGSVVPMTQEQTIFSLSIGMSEIIDTLIASQDGSFSYAHYFGDSCYITEIAVWADSSGLGATPNFTFQCAVKTSMATAGTNLFSSAQTIAGSEPVTTGERLTSLSNHYIGEGDQLFEITLPSITAKFTKLLILTKGYYINNTQ